MEDAHKSGLTNTLKELFQTFFPGKEFLGPQPTRDGTIAFPVKTASGSIHDLDELSAGEKEILYGYLRIRSSAPQNSIILLDEPELHLNPRLIRNLPEFYRKHLGENLHNQIWLVTHSDALLREAVGRPGFSVFHMFPCGTTGDADQLKELKVTEDLDLAMADLVGDLAAYRPGGDAIIFEGGGDSDYDQSMVSRLFTDEVAGFNLVSGTNRQRVEALHETLNNAYAKGQLPIRFFAITDRDSRPGKVEGLRMFSWDVYHIENYLIDETYVNSAVKALHPDRTYNDEAVLDLLRTAAKSVVPKMIRHLMRQYASERLIGSIDLKFDPAAEDIASGVSAAVGRSLDRISSEVTGSLAPEALTEEQNRLESAVEASFEDGSWRSNVPGRDILRAFVSANELRVPYEAFRNLIVSKMVDDGHKPIGMKSIIDKIVTEAN